MAAFTYEYKVKGLNKVSASVAGAVCEELTNSEDGLSPTRLVDVSRDETAPLHNEFEWDDHIAGEAWRIDQAKHLIANLTIVKTTDQEERESDTDGNSAQGSSQKSEPKDRAFILRPGGNSNYVTLKNALEDEQIKASMLCSAKRDMEIFVAKYRRLEDLSSVVNAINQYLIK